MSQSDLVSSILSSITRNDTYDKRLRPNYGGDPVNVSVRIHVNHLPSVSEISMDFTMDITLRQIWQDDRLKWKQPIKRLRVTDFEFIKTFWIPDSYFPNEKKASFMYTTVHQTYLHLRRDGQVLKEQRMAVTFVCPMALHYFPMDSQVCTVMVESYGYTTDEVRLTWGVEDWPPVKLLTEVKLATFEFGDMTLEQYEFSFDSGRSAGNYSRLFCHLRFDRKLLFYWIQIYQPAILIVSVSWVSFWINRESAPARVTLGITTVLTMTTLMSTTNQQMPKVSYVKAVDIYLVFCYVMVFAALVEYAAVSYSNKKKAGVLRVTAEKKSDENVDEEELEKKLNQEQQHPEDEIASLNKRKKQTVSILVSNQFVLTFPCQKCRNKECSKVNITRLRPKHKNLKCIIPSNERLKLLSGKVDKYSRILFPVVFLVFNAIYWVYYLIIIGQRYHEETPPQEETPPE